MSNEPQQIELHYYKSSAKNGVLRASGYICILIGLCFVIYVGFFSLSSGFGGALLTILLVATIPFFGGFLMLGLAKGLDLLVEIRDILKDSHKK